MIVLASACGGGGGGDDTPGDDVPGDDGTDPDASPGDPDANTNPACGPSNCNGCCEGTVCRGGNSPDACGAGGGACAACEVDFTCEAAACAVDPASRWDVLAVNATVFPDNTGGGTWDPIGGLPDPYVEMSAEDGPDMFHGTTSAISDTLTPTWDVVVLDALPARAMTTTGLLVTVYDDDLDPDDSMGTCVVTFDDAMFDESAVAYECPTSADARGWTLTLQLRRD